MDSEVDGVKYTTKEAYDWTCVAYENTLCQTLAPPSQK